MNQKLQSIEVSNSELHSYTRRGENPVEGLPNGAKRRLRIEWDNTVNTRGEKGLPHMAGDVMPAFREYLQSEGVEPSYARFQTFLFKNTWSTKWGEMKGEDAYALAKEALVDRMEEVLMGWGANSLNHNQLRKHTDRFVLYQIKTAYEGLLAERVAIREVANREGIMSREITETREEEAAGTDGRIGTREVQVKHESYADEFSGDQALIRWSFKDEKRSSDRKVVVRYDPDDFEDASKEEKVTEDDMPSYMMA